MLVKWGHDPKLEQERTYVTRLNKLLYEKDSTVNLHLSFFVQFQEGYVHRYAKLVFVKLLPPERNVQLHTSDSILRVH